MAKKVFFRAYPNPFTYIDHDGYPAGACHCDMVEHVGLVRKFVGARLDQEETKLLEKLTPEETRYRDPRQQTRWSYDFSQPTLLLETEYYRDRFRAGEIVCADKETHKLVGLDEKDWVEPKVVLQRTKASALKRWEAANGPGARPEFIDCLDTAIAALGSPAKASSDAEPPTEAAKPSKPSKGA